MQAICFTVLADANVTATLAFPTVQDLTISSSCFMPLPVVDEDEIKSPISISPFSPQTLTWPSHNELIAIKDLFSIIES